MDIRYCKRCNVIYKYGSNGLCSNCLKEIDDIMIKVRAYLEEHPLAGITELSENINENERDILYLLREGRLSIKSDSKALPCARCGVQIESEKYCKSCIDKMKTELKNAASKIGGGEKKTENTKYSSTGGKSYESTQKGKMHTSYRHKNH